MKSDPLGCRYSAPGTTEDLALQYIRGLPVTTGVGWVTGMMLGRAWGIAALLSRS